MEKNYKSLEERIRLAQVELAVSYERQNYRDVVKWARYILKLQHIGIIEYDK